MGPEDTAPRRGLAALGALLGAGSLLQVWLAFAVAQAADPAALAPLLVALQCTLGLLFLLLLRILPTIRATPVLLALAVLLGLGMRLVHIAAPPLFENDYNRYLWDGAVTANSVNPYRAAPATALMEADFQARAEPSAEATGSADRLGRLAGGAEPLIDKINYPFLTTIYPPLAQVGFAVAHYLAPYSLVSWRAVIISCELVAVFLLIRLLRDAGQSTLWSLLYWWNPLVILQFANAAHMDALLLPALLGALLAVSQGRITTGTLGLAVGAGIKLWPLVLLPTLRRSAPLRHLAVALGVCLTASLFFLLPMLLSQAASGSGLLTFAQTWHRNAFAFTWIAAGLEAVVVNPALANQLARLGVALIVVTVAFRLGRHTATDVNDLARRWAIVIAALFLLAPTGYPWYYAWLLPLLCLWRQPALLWLTALLPLYYLRFPLETAGASDTLRHLVVACQFLPVWLMLVWQWYRHRSPGTHAPRP